MRRAGMPQVRVAIDGPQPDETISSVLARAAMFWDVERWVLLESLGVTTTDWDHPSEPALQGLAEAIGVRASVLQALTVASDQGILPVDRRIAYCPSCWAEDVAQGRAPYCRRAWASCAAIACPVHATPLYAWDVDVRGERRPLPALEAARQRSETWHADLAHAQTPGLHRDLQPLAAFAQTAQAALDGDIPWPAGWRGDRPTGLALVRLLTTNPAPFPDRLVLDRLLPVAGDSRRFAGHRRASASVSSDTGTAWLAFGDPAIRRTAWWLLARTLVVGWPPLPIRGAPSVYLTGEAWWNRGVRPAVSGYAQHAFCEVGDGLGLTAPGQTLALFAA